MSDSQQDVTSALCCKTIMQAILPAIREMQKMHLLTPHFVVVAKKPTWQCLGRPYDEAREDFLTTGISTIHEEGENWLFPYDDIAASKLWLSTYHQKATSQIPLSDRKPGDTLYSGSAWGDKETVVAVSGFRQEYDEMISSWMVIAMLAHRKVKSIEHFIPKPVPT